MNTNSDKKIVKRGRCSSSIPYSLFPIPRFRGVSLMEVLASVFVIGVGLLGVLAVIPFGAFQVSKAQHAEYCSNMLVSAANELAALELAKPTTWRDGNNVNSIGTTPGNFPDSDATDVSNDTGTIAETSKYVLYGTPGSNDVNCTRFIMVDPLDTVSTMNPNRHISKIGSNVFNYQNRLNMWQERMRGQDDLLYTLSDSERTKWVGNTPTSSGRYSWFFTYKIDPLSAYTGSPTQVTFIPAPTPAILPDTVTVDLLGCYNRSPDADKSADINLANSSQYTNGARLELTATNEQLLDLKNTKYIFVTWSTGSGNSYRVDGNWCRILNVSDITQSGGNYSRYVIVNGDVSNLSGSNNPRAFIADGVLYHKSQSGVSIL